MSERRESGVWRAHQPLAAARLGRKTPPELFAASESGVRELPRRQEQEPVPAALRTLREADRGLEAGPEVETRLRAAYRQRRRSRIWTRASALGTIAAAAIALIVLPRHPSPEPAAPTAEEPVAIQFVEAPAEEPAAVSPVSARNGVRARTYAKQVPPSEVVTEFFPLMDTPPPFERGELVRIVLPASTMLTVGIPVSETHLADPVQADVLIGQEGLARAIRFVTFEQ
jgi:hypothetical protein